ncbi:MAG: methylated-DNA--[protein]-cysteine S-methyltransferase [Bdellovibrionales bacterium]|nr:methylated-DNA--[protein]-cysteine S-methyltransferase [Bdellovibrionales bacterium]
MNTYQYKMSTPIGPIYLVATPNGLRGIFWEHDRRRKNAPMIKSLREKDRAIGFLAQTVRELEEYFAGKRREFDVSLDVEGTPFQKQVWNQLSKIPYGKTLSYKEVAAKIKNEKAIRAVGTANGHNPVSIIVPCHRVIASDGTLGGYAGGLPSKVALLNLENAKFKSE